MGKPGVPVLEVRCCGGRQPPADFTFTGEAFTDRAMTGRAPRAARRAGWACVLVNSEAEVIAGFYGPCPDPFPTSLRAELMAVIQLFRMALPPVTIWVDNKGVVDGWTHGRAWCCASARPAADLWKQFWDKIDDIGAEGISIKKCKGHATVAGVEAGRSTNFPKIGNEHADHFAGRGVQAAEGQSSSSMAREAYREARRWYDWLFVLCSHWPTDMQPRPKAKAKARAAGPDAPQGAGKQVRLHPR